MRQLRQAAGRLGAEKQMMTKALARARDVAPIGDGAIASAPRTISTCARALLAWHGIDPLDIGKRLASANGNASIVIEEARCANGHLTMTVSLPMPYGEARMTVRTGAGASIAFPGMALSPAMTAATIGRPIGRLAGHPAFDRLDMLRVTAVRRVAGPGHATTILSFDDTADAIASSCTAAARVQ